MFLEAHALLEDLGEAYKSAGDQRKLEALGYVAFFSGYGAMQHIEEEADIENLEDEEALGLAVRAFNAAGQLHELAESLDESPQEEQPAIRVVASRTPANKGDAKVADIRSRMQSKKAS